MCIFAIMKSVYLFMKEFFEDTDSIKSAALDYITTIATTNVSPISSEEMVLDAWFSSFLTASELSAENYMLYANNQEKMYLEIAKLIWKLQ